MFVLTFSPLGEKVNTNMALIHRQVKKSTLGKIVNNHQDANSHWLRHQKKNALARVMIKSEINKTDQLGSI